MKQMTLDEAKTYFTSINGKTVHLDELTREELMIACAEQMELLSILEGFCSNGAAWIEQWRDLDVGEFEVLDDNDDIIES